MLRFIGIPIVFALCVFIGEHYAALLRGRVKLLRAFETDTKRLQLMMAHTKRDISSIIEAMKDSDVKPFWQALCAHIKTSWDMSDAWQKAMEDARTTLRPLTSSDRAMLIDYGATLGVGGRRVQEENGCMLEKRIEAAKENALAEEKSKARIYRTMGVLCGLALVLFVW